MVKLAFVVWTLAVACCAAFGPDPKPPVQVAVAAVLDELHDAASKGDGQRYFSLFAPDAVFFGTDASERWPISEFRAYAMERFRQGSTWTYHVVQRHVSITEDGHTAWFDERLHNDKYGECRGTGVLVESDGRWRIAQYNLTIPIPNEIALEVVAMIKRAEGL